MLKASRCSDVSVHVVCLVEKASGSDEKLSELPQPAKVAYAVHTGTEPLSMYDAKIWSMCFPAEFPYGDGVFALPRKVMLSFQQWFVMLVQREELDYQVTPMTLTQAAVWDPEAELTSSCQPLAEQSVAAGNQQE